MAPKSKGRKRGESESVGEAPPSASEQPSTPPGTKSAHAESTTSIDTETLVFGVNLEARGDVEDDSNVLAPIAKYAILGMICLMSFAIRLFAVVRYESVCSKWELVDRCIDDVW